MLELVEKPTISNIMQWACSRLEDCGCRSSRPEVEILLEFLLNCGRTQLYSKLQYIVTDEITERFNDFITKRISGIPLQYIIKQAGFYGMRLSIEDGVFIPRPETEILVEEVIRILAKDMARPAKILEFCTGSGNIAVALTKHVPDCTIIAVDINTKALELAKTNAYEQGVGERITFLHGCLEASWESDFHGERFDVVIANPPYIARHEIETLPREVQYEPHNALDGGPDGLMFFRRISGCGVYLNHGGYLVMEHGDSQESRVREIIESSGFFDNYRSVPDLNGMARVMIARRAGG